MAGKRLISEQSSIIVPKQDNQELPESYTEWLVGLKSSITEIRLQVILNANSGMVLLYWSMGMSILEKQKTEGWGAKIIERLAFDLK